MNTLSFSLVMTGVLLNAAARLRLLKTELLDLKYYSPQHYALYLRALAARQST